MIKKHFLNIFFIYVTLHGCFTFITVEVLYFILFRAELGGDLENKAVLLFDILNVY